MDIKRCTCYYFDDIININDIDLAKILLDEKYAAYKTPYVAKHLRSFLIKYI